MPLSKPQKQKLRDWMKPKGVRPTCASCGETDRGAGEMLSLSVLTPEGTRAESQVPMVQIVCINCSCTMVYAAMPVGSP